MKRFDKGLRTGVFLVFLLSSCSLGSPPTEVPRPTTPENNLPTVDAGRDGLVGLGEVLTLQGSASDQENDPLTYLWTLAGKPVGSNLETRDLQGVTTLEAACTPDAEGSYTFDLSVSDGKSTVTDRVVITVSPTANRSPSATAWASHRYVLPGTEVEFGGYGEDPNTDVMFYTLTLVSQPEGSALEFQADESYYAETDMDRQTLVLTQPGDYLVRFAATDPQGLVDTDEITVSVVPQNPKGNTAPFADAGPDLTISQGYLGQMTDWQTLDGTLSTDLDGDELSYSWTCLSAPPMVGDLDAFHDYLGSLNTIDPEYPSSLPAGTYVFELAVDDGQGYGLLGEGDNQPSVDTDTMTVTVLNTTGGLLYFTAEGPNNLEEITTPLAVGAYLYPDPDNYFLGEYSGIELSLVSRPAGSTAVLGTLDLAKPDIITLTSSLLPDVPGDYRLRVKVTDSEGTLSQDTVFRVFSSTQGGVDVVIK